MSTIKDYTVTIKVSVTAPNPQRAMQFALQDLRNGDIGPWTGEVLEAGATSDPETVSAG